LRNDLRFAILEFAIEGNSSFKSQILQSQIANTTIANRKYFSALAELRRSASSVQTGLLAFFDAGVTAEESGAL
jgi:hypothetical protein